MKPINELKMRHSAALENLDACLDVIERDEEAAVMHLREFKRHARKAVEIESLLYQQGRQDAAREIIEESVKSIGARALTASLLAIRDDDAERRQRHTEKSAALRLYAQRVMYRNRTVH